MDHLSNLFARYPKLEGQRTEIAAALELLINCFKQQGKLLTCGNGGSAADADHIVGELMKGFYLPRKLSSEEQRRFGEVGDKLQGALPAVSLTQQAALLSALANDVSADMVYAQQVYGYGCPQDVLIGISTSGNASNVIRALEVARAKGMSTILLTGANGGKGAALADVTIKAPATITAEVQEYHLPIYHYLCAAVEAAFFG